MTKKIGRTPAILVNDIVFVVLIAVSVFFILTKPEEKPNDVVLLMTYALAPAMLWFAALALIGLQIANFTNVRLSRAAQITFRVLAGSIFGLMIFSPAIFGIPVHAFKVLVSLLLLVAVMAPIILGVFGFLYGLSWAQTKSSGEKNLTSPNSRATDGASADESSPEPDGVLVSGTYHKTLTQGESVAANTTSTKDGAAATGATSAEGNAPTKDE